MQINFNVFQGEIRSMKHIRFDTDGLGQETQYCKWCEYTTTSEQELSAHLLIHAQHSCPQCGLALSRPSALAHHLKVVHQIDQRVNKNVAEKVLHICKVCKKVYASAGGLHTHMISAHSGKVYSCNECQSKFNHPKNLASHSARHRGKHVRCPECSATFYMKSELNKHINQVHRRCRPYVCEDCGRSFCQRSVLKHHRMVHSDHRPLTCPICGRTFKHRNAFNYHLEQESKQLQDTYQINTSELSDTVCMDTSQPVQNIVLPDKSAECIRVRKVDVTEKKTSVNNEVKSGKGEVTVDAKISTSLNFVCPTIPAVTEPNTDLIISHDTNKYSEIKLFRNSTLGETLPLSNSYGDHHITLVTHVNEEATDMASFVLDGESSRVLEVEHFTAQCEQSAGLCDPSKVTYNNKLDDLQITCISEMQEGHSSLDPEAVVTQYIKDGIPECCVLVEDFMSAIDSVNDNLEEKDVSDLS